MVYGYLITVVCVYTVRLRDWGRGAAVFNVPFSVVAGAAVRYTISRCPCREGGANQERKMGWNVQKLMVEIECCQCYH